MSRLGRGFPIQPWILDPVVAICTVTGTATASITEADIVTGGKTIILTLVGGPRWVTAGATFNAERQGIIDGLDAASSPALGWNDEVRDKEVVTAVVRTSNTVVTITLTASALYDVSSQEIVTVTVPSGATDYGAELTAQPTFTVDAVAATSIPIFAHHYRQLQGVN